MNKAEEYVILENGTKHNMKDGDVFKWYWKDTPNTFNPYHCLSRLCKYKVEVNYDGTVDKSFRDLFWSMGGGIESRVLTDDKIVLNFLGNLADYSECRSEEFKYYNDKDILDIRHSNHSEGWGGCCFIRKGAERDTQRIIDGLETKKAELLYKIESAQNDLERVEKDIEMVTSGNVDLNTIWF